MKASNDIYLDKTDIGSLYHYLVWFELGKIFSRNRKKRKRFLYKWRANRLQDKTVRSEYQI